VDLLVLVRYAFCSFGAIPTSKLLDTRRLEFGSVNRLGESRSRLRWRESFWRRLCERHTKKLVYWLKCSR
jgi:hypothetical protein